MNKILRLALGSVLASASLTAAAAPGELLVKFRPSANPTLINSVIGARVLQNFPQIGWQKVKIPAGYTSARASRYYSSLSSVAAVEENNVIVRKRVVPNDPLVGNAAGKQYQHAQIGMYGAWELSLGSPSVTVAVMDSGTRTTHEDLAPQHRSDSLNMVDGSSDFSDPDGHGTHVAGLAASTANNGKGGAGTGWNVRLMTLKLSYATSSFDDVAEGLIYAADKRVQVINMSFGFQVTAQIMEDALKYAHDKDVVLVAAAGNDNVTFCGYPSQSPNVLNVGSTDLGSGKSGFSNYGAEVDVAAPGGAIVSTAISGDSNYITYSGTSMASPVTAGAVALMRAYAPEFSGDEIVQALKDTAIQSATPFTVHGQIDVAAAMRSLARPRIDDVTPTGASIVAQEGTIVNPTGSPSTDASYLNQTDGSSLEIRSNYRAGLGTVAGVTTDFRISAARDKIITSRMRMSVSAAAGVTMLVMVQNPSTGAYEQFTSTRLGASATSLDLPLPRATLLRYLRNDGTMRVMLRAINPSRLAPGGVPFRASFDSIGVRVTVNTR